MAIQRDLKSEEARALFNKGGEIIDLVRDIVALIPEDDDMLQSIAEFMKGDSYILQVKVVGAEAGRLWDIRMECAALIRQAGNSLYVQKHNLEAFDFEYVSYMDLLRTALDEYKMLFKAWITTFDPQKAIEDEWGLFNPPGRIFDDSDDIDFDDDEDEDFDVFGSDED
jgi:hypothetical protein